MELSAAPAVDRPRLEGLLARELERFASSNPRSRELFERGRGTLLGGVPMSWMAKWAGGFPLFLREASGARVVDVDGHEYVDFCLGDTGAMAGHAPPATVAAVAGQAARGITAMLPSEDSVVAAEELTRRFGVRGWQFTLSATDANRFAIRLAREITERPKILVFDYCYHGTVDETFATLDGDRIVARSGNVGPPVDVALTTKVVQWNDADALEQALAPGDVACVLAEPALTNIGIVLPEPGFHDVLRELTRRTGTLLIIDETHTFSAGPGGCTAAWGLEPDLVTIGKSIGGGGVPAGAYGVSDEVAARIVARDDADYDDVGGIGGTLAGNALSLAAVRATLAEVLTEDAFGRMIPLAARFAAGVADVIEEAGIPWHVTELGCRAEYRFSAAPPRNGADSAALADESLERFLHLQALNRGILMTPFHNMALMSPATSEADVDLHTRVFTQAVRDVVG